MSSQEIWIAFALKYNKCQFLDHDLNHLIPVYGPFIHACVNTLSLCASHFQILVTKLNCVNFLQQDDAHLNFSLEKFVSASNFKEKHTLQKRILSAQPGLSFCGPQMKNPLLAAGPFPSLTHALLSNFSNL